MNYKKMPTGYGIVQSDIMKMKDLSIQAKALYSLLASITGSNTYCFPKMETISEYLGISRQMVSKYMKELVEKKLIKKTKMYNDIRNNNKYEVMFIDNECKLDDTHDVNYTLHPKVSKVDVINNNSINNNSINNINSKLSDDNPIPQQVIDYLNEKTGKKFTLTKTYKKSILKHLKEFTLEDFKRVIDYKYQEWHKDKAMCQYIRPSTLFSGKFDKYVDEAKNVVIEAGIDESGEIKYTYEESEMMC